LCGKRVFGCHDADVAQYGQRTDGYVIGMSNGNSHEKERSGNVLRVRTLSSCSCVLLTLFLSHRYNSLLIP